MTVFSVVSNSGAGRLALAHNLPIGNSVNMIDSTVRCRRHGDKKCRAADLAAGPCRRLVLVKVADAIEDLLRQPRHTKPLRAHVWRATRGVAGYGTSRKLKSRNSMRAMRSSVRF